MGGGGAGFDGVRTQGNNGAIRRRVRCYVTALSPRGRERDLIDTQGSQSDKYNIKTGEKVKATI